MSTDASDARDQVLVVSQPYDAHTDVILDHLDHHDVEVVRLHREELCGGVELSHRVGPAGVEGTLHVRSSGRSLHAGRVRAVWWRRLGEYAWPEAFSEAEQRFAEREIEHALRGFLETLDCRWVSHPEAIAAAGWKGEQLARATGLGFSVPPTLVTSRRADAVAFFDACGGEVVYKVLGDPFLGRATDDDGLPLVTSTTVVTRDQLDGLEAIEPVPCQFQQRVPKARELRVTVIGRDLYTAAVTPFLDGRELIDWRGHEPQLTWQAWDLDGATARRCLQLVDGYGLHYAAIDLIVTPDDDVVFLEINPAGQFLFVEHLVPDLQLGAAFASYLATGSTA